MEELEKPGIHSRGRGGQPRQDAEICSPLRWKQKEGKGQKDDVGGERREVEATRSDGLDLFRKVSGSQALATIQGG